MRKITFFLFLVWANTLIAQDIELNSNYSIKGNSGSNSTQLLYWNGSNAYYGRKLSGMIGVNSHYFRINGETKLMINELGNIGIGTIIPTTPLEIQSSGFDKGLQIGTNGKNTKIAMFVASGDYGYLNLGGTTILRGNGRVSHFQGNLGIGLSNPSTPLEILSSSSDKGLLLGTSGKSTKISMFVASGDYGYLNLGGRTILRGNGRVSHFQGKLSIGTTTTGSHMLAVEGSIGAREIQVEASGWSDFVFENDYKLRSLEETEKFIIENKHLPDIPNQNEVDKEGINLGEMDAKLLQKIEELTLYLIEQNKLNKALLKKVTYLENELNSMKKK